MVRLTFEFPEEVDEMMNNLARAENINKPEVIRRALALYQYVHKEAIEQKRKLSITDEHDTIIKDIVFR